MALLEMTVNCAGHSHLCTHRNRSNRLFSIAPLQAMPQSLPLVHELQWPFISVVPLKLTFAMKKAGIKSDFRPLVFVTETEKVQNCQRAWRMARRVSAVVCQR